MKTKQISGIHYLYTNRLYNIFKSIKHESRTYSDVLQSFLHRLYKMFRIEIKHHTEITILLSGIHMIISECNISKHKEKMRGHFFRVY